MKFKKYIVFSTFVLMLLSNTLFASGLGGEFNVGLVPNETINGGLKGPIDRIFGSIILVLQLFSVAGVIVAGLRYMFISPDAKADIKKSLISLIIGLIIVFSAATLSSYIRDVFISMTS